MKLPGHICPAHGCGEVVPRTKLMCARHWRMVSKPTGDELYAAYRAGAGSRRHVRAMDAAIAEVNEKLATAGKESK